MKKAIKATVTLEKVAKHFKQWRSIKKKGERIPDHLWYEAVGLLNSYGSTLVTRTLRLSSTDLNKRRRLIESEQHKPNSDDGTAFVEIGSTLLDHALESKAPAAWMELERPDGLRLRIQPTHSADMLALVDRFMGG